MNRTSIDGVITRTVRDTAAAYDYLTQVPNGGTFIKMCGMVPVDYDLGLDTNDLNYDYPPYGSHGRRHIKLLVRDYVVTSAMIIICKG